MAHDKKPQRENAQSTGIDLDAPDDTAETARIFAATSGQGEVKPEDYPAETRRAQVEAATGSKRPEEGGDVGE